MCHVWCVELRTIFELAYGGKYVEQWKCLKIHSELHSSYRIDFRVDRRIEDEAETKDEGAGLWDIRRWIKRKQELIM